MLDLPLRRLSMRRALSILVLLLAPFSLRAQQENHPNPASPQAPGSPVVAETKTAPRPRPKIGVALEGGGAMGLAHIGVLKWFEEHHIPVDYVAGTSMGGLVGGFYATGMSPDELKTLIEGMDWRKILGDRTPYEDLAFRRKEDQRAYPNSLIFGLREGLSLPAGLNAGHQIGLIIDRMTKCLHSMPCPSPSAASPRISSAANRMFSKTARWQWRCAQPCPFPELFRRFMMEKPFSWMADFWTICRLTSCVRWARKLSLPCTWSADPSKPRTSSPSSPF